MLSTKFRVNWPFGSEIEAKNRFSRWRLSWISDRNDLSYFLIYNKNQKGLPLETKNSQNHKNRRLCLIAFCHMQHYSLRGYKSPRCFLPRFQVNWPFGSGEKMAATAAVLDLRSE